MQPTSEKEDLHLNRASENATGLGGDASGGGKLIVLTAPLSESIDHAGFFIQMALASIPQWLEFVLIKKYPKWREVEHNEDGSARYMPAGVRVLEKSLLRKYSPEDVVACFPDDLEKFIGPDTRVVAVSTHNPLGVTFAAGVYTSIYGSSKEPLNSIYSRMMFDKIKSSLYRKNFQVVVGGSGGWQITQTNAFEELGVDCVAEGRSKSADTLALFQKAIAGEALPREINLAHPTSRDAILYRRHVYLGPGAHGYSILFPQPRSPGGPLYRDRQHTGGGAASPEPLHHGAFRGGSGVDPAALGSAASEESHSSAAAQHPPAKEGPGPIDWTRNRVRAHGPTNHAQQRSSIFH